MSLCLTIHAAFMLLNGLACDPSPAVVVGWGSPISPTVFDLAEILGVRIGQVDYVVGLPPHQPEQLGEWPATPEQVGYMAMVEMLPRLAPVPATPSLVLLYAPSQVKGLEGYFASPIGPVNDPTWLDGMWVHYETDVLVLNLNADRGLVEAIHSYSHQWEHALREYRPDIWADLSEGVGTVHYPVGTTTIYEYGTEGEEAYLKRWLATAAEFVHRG